MLDSLIDHDHDIQTKNIGYIRYYPDHDLLAKDLANAARRAVQDASRSPNGAHHAMTLIGVAAYYLSAPTANSDFARHLTSQVHQELKPLIPPPSRSCAHGEPQSEPAM